jgi:hypothetical protein
MHLNALSILLALQRTITGLQGTGFNCLYAVCKLLRSGVSLQGSGCNLQGPHCKHTMHRRKLAMTGKQHATSGKQQAMPGKPQTTSRTKIPIGILLNIAGQIIFSRKC